MKAFGRKSDGWVVARLAAWFAVLIAANPTHAAEYSWNTAVTTGLWDTTTNWLPNAVPVSPDTIYFGNSAATTVTVGQNSAAGMTFDNSGATTLSSGTLTLGASGISKTNTTGTATLGSVLTLSSSQIWTNAATSGTAMVVSGSIGATTGAVTLTGSGAGTTLVSGVIGNGGGTVSLTKAGSGTLILSAGNTYTGGTLLNSGTLAISTATALGTGTVTLAGGNLMSVATTGNPTIANNIWVSGTSTITRNGNQNFTLSGTIGGSGNLTLNTGASNSSLYLAGTNLMTSGTITYEPSTSGIVRISNANAGNANVAWVFNRTANFDFAGPATIYFGSLSGSGGLAGNAAGLRTIVTGSLGLNDSYSGSIADGTGTTALTKVGNGTLTLTGANTYTGGTLLNSGTLAISTATALGTGTVTLAGGNLMSVATGADFTTANNILVAGTSTITRNGSKNFTLSGTIGGSGNLTLNTGTANSSLYLAGTNLMTSGTITYEPSTSGIVRISNANAGNANVAWVFNRLANFDTGAGTRTIYFGSLSGSGSLAGNTAGNLTIRVGNLGLNDLYTGAISNGAGTSTLSLTKEGNGTLTLTGANTYTGGTIIESGTLNATYTNTTGANANFSALPASSVSVAGGAALVLTVNSTSSRDANLVQTISGSGSTTVTTTTGNRFLNLSGSNRFSSSGDLRIASGTAGAMGINLQGFSQTIGALIGDSNTSMTAGTTNSTTLTLGNNNNSGTFAGVLSNSGLNITKVGNGTQIFSGANVYTGTTTISGGTLQVGAGGTTGSLGTGAIVNSATLVYSFGTTAGLMLPTTAKYSGSGNLTATAGNIRFGGDLSLGSGTFTYNATSTSNIGGSTAASTITAGAATLAGSVYYNAVNTSLLKIDTSAANGPITLDGITSGKNNVQYGFNNLEFKAGSGSLAISGTNNLSWWSAGATIKLVGQITGSGNIAQAYMEPGAGTATLTLDNPGSSTYSGVISGANIALVKAGVGTQILAGSSTYAGTTTVSGGRLQVGSAGSINSTSGITLNGSGAEFTYNSATALTRPLTLTQGTLSGTGTVNTAVTVGANVIHSPGNSPGSQTVQSETWASGGTYLWEVNDWNGAAGTAYDQINVTNTLDLTATSGSTFKIAVTGLTAGNAVGAVPNFTNTARKAFTIATSGSLANFAANKLQVDTASFSGSNALGNGGFVAAASGNDVTLTFIPSAVYDLAAAPNNAVILVGGSSTITATVTNNTTGRTNPDSIDFTGLSLTGGLSPAPTSGSGIAAGNSGSGSAVFTGLSSGSFTFTPGIGSVTNATLGTAALAGTTSAASVTVLDHATSSLAASLLTSTTISLGSWNYSTQTWDAGTGTSPFSIYNVAGAGGAALTADLALLSVSGSGSGFTTNLGSYTAIAGGQFGQYSISVDPVSFLSSGIQSRTFMISLGDPTGLSGAAASNTLAVTAEVIIVPEPGAMTIAGIGIGIAAWLARRRRT